MSDYQSANPPEASLPPGGARNSSSVQQQGSRGLTISTSSATSLSRPASTSDSTAAPHTHPFTTLPSAGVTNHHRQVTSRHSSVSSTTSSFISPAGSTPAHASGLFSTAASRSRNPTSSTHSPRLATNVASFSYAGGSAGGAISRLARHSPAHSLSTGAGSPVSSTAPHSATASSSGQLSSLLLTQLNILLSTIKEDTTDRAKWEVQAEKIRKLVNESGMELFITYFRRLLLSTASTVFSTIPRGGQENAGSYPLLVDEVQKIVKEPQQADKIAQALDTSEGEILRDFDLQVFVDHFGLDAVAKVSLALACTRTSKPDLHSKAEVVLNTNFQPFLSALAQPQTAEPENELPPLILASITERIIRDPPRNWTDDQRDNLFYAIRIRYNNMRQRVPPAVEAAMFLDELLASHDSRLTKLVQRAGPRGSSTTEAWKEMLAGAETRDINYNQIASALLFMVIAENGDAYDLSLFVDAIRQHRAGLQIDWTDVVGSFDREHLRVTKKQFLLLYNALMPLAREYANFDIQTLWSGQWTSQETQLSFVVAFLTTTPEELDVMQIPNLRQAFDLTDFATASDEVRAFAEEAIKHPLVSRDATEALFTMIFRSQEAYNVAQMLGIPETVINSNMTIFVCAASACTKPWAPLQEQALKQLFFPFLTKQHENYDFVMHSLWQHDKAWIAMRLVEFYQQDQMLLLRIYEHAAKHNWLETIFTIQSNFAVDLATYAHGKGHCNLEDWASQHINSLGPPHFARAVAEFLKAKIDDETMMQRERVPPSTVPLAVKTVHTLLMLMGDGVPDDVAGQLYRQCLQTYPRLFNYGQDDTRDSIISAAGEPSNMLPESATKEMEERYKEMYGGTTNPESLVTELNRLKISEDPAQQDLFAAMLSGLFEEYNCFGEYPNEALALTAVLFGGLVSYHVLSGIAEQAAIFMIFEAVSEYTPEDPMYRFGLQALIHVLPRLKEWPHLAERILSTPSLIDTQAISVAEHTLKELQSENVGSNGDGTNGITNGIIEEEFPADAVIPTFTAIQVDPPLQGSRYEEPNDDISDKVMFVLNNISKRNLDEKFKEIDTAVEDKYNQWFAHYLVEDLAKSQPNFQSLYLNVLEKFDEKMLWAEVLRETYLSCQKMLNAPSTMENSHERTLLKNLAAWLGSITLARNQPILHRNLSFKDLLIEGYDTQRLLVAIPFTCKTLGAAKHSKIFRPPNPWITELLGVLSELYHCVELKLNMKFEIEMLCRELDIDIKAIEPLEAIRSRPTLEPSMLQQFVPDGGPDAFGDMALMGLSKRGPNERFSPDAVIQAVPDLGNMLQIPQAVNGITQPQLRTIFVNAAQQAIYEIIAPVVERSVTIASISTSELIQKDFVSESDEIKVRNSSHTMVKALSGSLAMVTCKEPLRMSITNNIRILASRNLPEQLPEGQILMFVNDNIDTVCGLVEHAAEEHSLAEIDLQLQQAIEDRHQHNEQRPNEPFALTPLSRWSTLIPDPYRQDPNGLNRQQLTLYEDFGRQARLAPAAHSNTMSQDSSRQVPDVLSENFLPSLPTPAEVPAIPRQIPQQRMQPSQGQLQVNGYMDSASTTQRVVELMQELSTASKDTAEEHVSTVVEGTPIRRIFGQLLALIQDSNPNHKDQLIAGVAQSCLTPIFNETERPLEVEVFARLLGQLCHMSHTIGRQMAMQLANMDDDRAFNAVATASLHAEGLLDLQQIDSQAARMIKARRAVVLPYLRDLLEEMLLGDNSVAFRSDFVLTYDALAQWLSEEPGLDLAKEIVVKLQTPASQVNGMPSPCSDIAKTDQQEYLFDEWLRLQYKNLPERSYLAFVQQLHSKRMLSTEEDAITFFRCCMEHAVLEFDRISNNPYGSLDQAYVAVDGLGKLMAILVTYQAPVDSVPQINKIKTLDAHVTLIVLIMSDHHNKQRDRWNGRVYFRLFSTLLCELREVRQLWTPEQEQEIYMVFGRAFLTLQPRYFSGFLHQWLALVSHRLFIDGLLSGAGRTNGGWNMYAQLLTALFLNLGHLLSIPETTPVAQDFYRGVLRFFTMLHHDFPEFLIENHMQLNACIPSQCLQLQNIVNSAVTRVVFNDQPDPFTPGLKINRLEQVRQAPAVHSDMGKVLDESGIRAAVDRVVVGNDLSEQDFHVVLSVVDREDGQVSPILINALVLYIGVHTTSASSVFSSAVAPARLLERVLRESRPEVRYHIITAMANQVRYVNAHTHYFSTALQHMFSIGSPELQEQIMRVLCERLMVPRPHPWGLIVMMLEMVKNQSYDIWNLPWVKTAPQVESMLMNLAHSQDNRLTRSPLGAIM